MILLLSQDTTDPTVEEVQDWIAALGGASLRLNGEDLNGEDAFTLRFGPDGPELDLEPGGRPLRLDEVRAVWLRRWHAHGNLAFAAGAGDAHLANTLHRFLVTELRAASGALYSLLAGVPWLTRPGQADVNKLAALEAARRAGLDVPPTLVTNDRAELRAFLDRHGRVVTKALWNGAAFPIDDAQYVFYTTEVTREAVDSAPERFFPSLFQAMLEKRYEVRAFYLDGECHAMALFSQLDPQTATDFRVYNPARPNRYVPYRLPAEVEDAVRALMRSLGLETGSLDLVRTTDGRHVFLEVNPIGQFAMVSAPCNYRLEKKVAQNLMAKAAHG